MMYKLLNKLFGWDYIYWKNCADQGIARVHVSPDGEVYYWRYKTTNYMDVIKTPNQVSWLTCKSDKYLKALYTKHQGGANAICSYQPVGDWVNQCQDKSWYKEGIR